MKILRIELKNLHSLLGEFNIDFRKGSLAQTSLFAITGETGAGKTTILDAITLALYAKTSRHENLNYNIKQDEIWENVVSKGEAEAHAELLFEVEGETYRARWEVKRRPRATGFEYSRVFNSLTREDFKFHTIKEVEMKIQATMQLTYDQFLRSIMLAQGNFMSFLKAEEKERKELLSKITNTHIYEKIIQKAKENLKEERQKKERLEESLQGIDLLNEMDFEKLKQEREDLIQEVQRLEKLWLSEGLILEKTKNFNMFFLKLEANRQEKAQIQQEILHQQEKFALLASHQKAVQIKPDWDSFQKLDRDIIAIKNQIIETEKKLKEVSLFLSSYENSSEEAKQTLAVATQKIENFEKWVEIEVAPLEKEIAILENDCKKGLSQWQQEHKKVQELEKNKVNIKKILKTLENKKNIFSIYLAENNYIKDFNSEIFKPLLENRKRLLRECQEKIKVEKKLKNDILEKHKEALQLFQDSIESTSFEMFYISILEELQNSEATFETIEKERKQIDTKENEQKEKQNLLYQTEKQLQSLKDIREIIVDNNIKIKEKNEIERDLPVLEQALKKAATELSKVEESLSQQKRIYFLERKVLDLEQDRQKLMENEPCPLCGSRLHPYRQQGHQVVLSETERKLALLEEAKKEQEDLIQKITLIKKEKETQQNTLINQIEKTKKNKSDKITAFLSQNALYPDSVQSLDWENEASIETFISFLEKNIAQERNEIKKIEDEIFSKKLEIKVLEKKQNLYQILSLYAKEKNDLQAKIKEGTENLERLKVAFSKFNQIVDKNSDFELILKKLEQQKQEFEQTQKQWESVGQEMVAQEATLKEVEKNYQNLSKNLVEIEEKYNSLQREKANKEAQKKALLGEKSVAGERELLKRAKEKAQQNLDAAKGMIEKYKNLKIENETKIATLSPQIEEKLLEKLNLEKKLRQSFEESGFASSESFEQALALEEQAKDWLVLKNDLEEKSKELDRNQSYFENEIKKLREEIADRLPEEGENLTDYIQKLEEKNKQNKIILDQKREKIGTYEQQIIDQNQKIEKFEQKLREKDEQEAVMRRWEMLCEVLAPKGRDSLDLNAFAQGITLGYLIELANERLRELSPRYILKRKDTTSLNFVVIDLDQNEQERLVSSLSGGESFLVSLALALALSELTSHRRSLQSLFIDEGFGTLDPQTLETALDALEKLQGQGKMIGIISHVELIKNQDRIPVQILVQKIGGGRSKIILPEERVENLGV
jgi:exonuclease SbcC